MSLAMIGAKASYEFRWRSWAMLRDVLVAHLDERSLPGFTSLGDAIVSGRTLVDSVALAFELERIRSWLVDRSVDDLVIGPRTSAILHWGAVATGRRRLTTSEVEGIRPIGASQNLAEYFETMLDSMAHVCANPYEDGTIEVVDG